MEENDAESNIFSIFRSTRRARLIFMSVKSTLDHSM